MPEPNRPETYLTPQERQLVNRLLGFPEEFPQKFIAWLDDHLKVNVPQFPVTQIRGFQNFQQNYQQFVNGQAGWEFIDAKGDLVLGYADNVITTLPIGANGSVLVADSTQGGGARWAARSGSAGNIGAGVEILFTNPSVTAATGSYYGFVVPSQFGGLNLTDATGFVFVASSSGTPTIQVHNVTQAADMLSTPCVIATSAHTDAGIVDTGNDDVATGDVLRFDLTTAGDAQGHGVILTFG